MVRHRSRGDWSLPKGKLADGESFKEAALREVAEETGLTCRILEKAGQVDYQDRKGRRKTVRLWLMEPVAGRLRDYRPNGEIDEVRWVTPIEAVELLEYGHDRDLVESLELSE